MQVRRVCEMLAGMTDYTGLSNIENIIDKSWGKIFNTKFTIFDEAYRETLCKKIIRHYYMREIAHETAGLWIFRINVVMNEIMPYYNELYKSIIKKFNPEDSFSIKKNYTKNNNDSGTRDSNNTYSSSGENNSNSTVRNYESDTPQGGIGDVEDNSYLSKFTKNTSDTNSNSSENGFGNTHETLDNTGKEVYEETSSGYNSINELIEYNIKAREAIINIDMLIINDLEKLFFKLF